MQKNTGKTHFKEGHTPWNKGKHGYMGANKTSFKKGQKAWNKGIGDATENKKIRWSDEYKAWRAKVFKRDNYTCQICSYVGADLNAHHLIHFSDDKIERFNLDNGITLCKECHKQQHMKKNKEIICCRWSPTLGELESTHQKTWGTKEYTELDIYNPTVFFGIYSFADFFSLWRHKGKKWILWAGSDLRRFKKGYWLDEKGLIRLNPQELADWLNKNCENWVENESEAKILRELGVEPNICPSFLGDVSKFKVNYKWSERPKVYASVSGDDFNLYKWHLIDETASSVPEIEFHLYGNTVPFKTNNKNVIIHGRVDQETMNKEIQEMQAGIRLIEVEGCSEVIVKSALWGQWPISRISYPHVSNALTKKELIILLRDLINKKEPDLDARKWFLENLNNYPFNSK